MIIWILFLSILRMFNGCKGTTIVWICRKVGGHSFSSDGKAMKIIAHKLDRAFLKRWRTFSKSSWCFSKLSLTNQTIRLDRLLYALWRMTEFALACWSVRQRSVFWYSFLYTWKSLFQPFTLFTVPLLLSFFASLWITMSGMLKCPFHRRVNRVKGSGTNFYVYMRARELGSKNREIPTHK